MTGATGFIGGALVRRLLQNGCNVRRAVRDVPKNPSAVQLVLPGAVSDWEKALSGVDGVFHLAWSTVPGSANKAPLDDLSTNVAGTLGLLEVLKAYPGVPMVMASSGGTVYGAPELTPIPETHPLKPMGVYGASKVAAENYALLYRRQFDVDARIARLSNPFGPGQNVDGTLGAATVFAWKAITGQEISIWGDGSVIRDFVYIDDTVDALIALMGAPKDAFDFHGSILNVGSGKGVSLKHIVTTIENSLARKLQVKYGTSRSFDVPTNVLDVRLAEKVLHWKPRTTFEEGMSRLLHSFQDLAIANV